MSTTDRCEREARNRLVRNPVAIECARAAAGFAGGRAEIVIFEDAHVVVAASSDGRGAFLPRSMKRAEAALREHDGALGVTEMDGAHSTAICDPDGGLVAALTVWDHAVRVDHAAAAALARVVQAEIGVAPSGSSVDFHAEVLRGQRDAVLVLGSDLSIRWISEGVGSLIGRTPAEVVGRSAADFIHPDDVEATLDAITRISQRLELYRLNIRLSNSSGDYTPVEITGTDMSDHESVGGLVLSLRDAQHDRELGITIDRERRTSDAIVGGLRDGVLATDEFGAVTAVNQAARTMFGIAPSVAPAQMDVDRFALVTLDGRTRDILDTDGSTNEVCCLVSLDGGVRYLTVSCQEIVDDSTTLGNVVIFTDVTSDHRAAEELRSQAMHDQLTGLANRRQLEQWFEELATAGEAVDVVVCLVDLDGFKGVNDTHGHRVGDQLVRLAAKRLALELRDADLLVRHGGDEFVVLMLDGGGVDEAAAVAERCRRVLAEPYELDGHRFDLTGSVGVATASTTDLDGDRLLKHADLALYAAKDNGRNRVEIFDEAMAAAAVNEDLQRRLLREALDDDRLVMHFQPLVDARSEAVVGYEALARLRTADGEILPPSMFLSGVDGTSLMWEFDQAAFELSCQAAALFSRVDADVSPYVACNFSPVSVQHPDFVDFLEATIVGAGVDPAKICIELTESAAFDAGQRGLTALAAVGARGFRIALDDFGTGYSSLAHIRDLPISSIKVDRSFVVRLGQGTNERTITEAVVRLAEDLEVDIVAEGVETQLQLDQVRSLGFSTIQGWYYARAMPLAECLHHWSGRARRDSRADGVDHRGELAT